MTLKQFRVYLQSLIEKLTTPQPDSQDCTSLRAGHSEAPRNPGFYTACMVQRSQWDHS
jgi:hypothetical protein